jgi:molybdate transport system permease protein
LDWPALNVSLRLAFWTTVVLVPLSLLLARFLAFRRFRGAAFLEALVALPLVLPPTVLGYYLLVALGGGGWPGRWFEQLTGETLVFSFKGLLIASLIFNLPFAVQPMQRGFEAIPASLREAAWVSGLSAWRTFLRIELPLAWPGLLTAMVLVFAHTMGEFGVVLMVGGNIPGETETIAISIYDRVQAFDEAGAGLMAAFLLGFSFLTIALVYLVGARAVPFRG